MKLILGNSPNTDNFESQRRQDKIHRQFRHDRRSRNFLGGLRWVLAQVRAVFVLLLVAAVMEFVFAHRDQIQQYADAKIDHTVAKVRASGDSSRIRQSAENHEKEVNDVINK